MKLLSEFRVFRKGHFCILERYIQYQCETRRSSVTFKWKYHVFIFFEVTCKSCTVLPSECTLIYSSLTFACSILIYTRLLLEYWRSRVHNLSLERFSVSRCKGVSFYWNKSGRRKHYSTCVIPSRTVLTTCYG